MRFTRLHAICSNFNLPVYTALNNLIYYTLSVKIPGMRGAMRNSRLHGGNTITSHIHLFFYSQVQFVSHYFVNLYTKREHEFLEVENGLPFILFIRETL